MQLVGREGEIARLEAGLAEALAGRGGLFTITGEAGIGKTALARAASELAKARGYETSWARGWEGEGAPAYWPFIQIFRALGRDFEALARSSPSGDASQRFTLFDTAAG